MPAITWRKSTFSASDGNCVEVGWRKSSFSSDSQGNCVEVALARVETAVRDSKNPGPTLRVPPTAWRTFTRMVEMP